MTLTPDSVLLTGRVAVVTGGGSGIGRGVARTLAAFGATVVIWELKAESCASAAEEIGCLGLTVDVRDSEQVDAALARTRAEAGDVRILVNNAGGVFWSSFLETSEKGWDALYRANLRHVLLCTQRVARTMVDAGLPGSIMSVTSIEGVRAAPGYAAYAAAKAGVINFTKTVALELAPHGIRVNALAPDITMTEGLAEVTPPGSEEHFGHGGPGRAGRARRRDGGRGGVFGLRPVQLRDRADAPRRWRHPCGQRLVPPPHLRAVRPRPFLTGPDSPGPGSGTGKADHEGCRPVGSPNLLGPSGVTM